MKKLLVSLLLLLPLVASAENTYGIHLGSWHSSPGYNNSNPGVYVRSGNGLQVGAYYNSYSRPSVYVAKFVELSPHVDFMYGLATGYPWPVAPVGALSVHVGNVRVMYAPSLGNKIAESHVVHLALEF